MSLAHVVGILRRSGAGLNFSNVVLLMHYDGTNGSTTFTDVKGNTVTPNGNAQISTSEFQFGGASGLFDGSGDRLVIPDSNDWYFGTGAFTIEFFARMTLKTNLQTFITQWGQNAATQSFAFYIENSALKFRATSPSNTLVDLEFPWVPVLDQWYHLCAERDSTGKLRIYINGVMVGSSTSAFNFDFKNTTTSLVIGAIGSVNSFPSYDFQGRIDEMRITKGVAVYGRDTGFIAPTVAYPDGFDPEPNYEFMRIAQQRMHAVVAPSPGTIAIPQQRMHTIVGPANNSLGISQQRMYTVVGPANNTIGISQQRMHAIIIP